MNHHEATLFFDTLGEGADSRASMANLLAACKAAERRKRRRTVGASVLAVALILGGGAVVEQAVGGDDGTPAPDHVAQPPVPPDGTRLVGKGRVVLAVPESWSTGATRCEQAVEPTVWFPQEIDVDCPSPPDGLVPQLKIGDLDSPLGASIFERSTTTTTRLEDGTEVVEDSVFCAETCSVRIAVPSENTYFIVIIPDSRGDAAVQRIRDSLQVLPAGYTTVPYLVGQQASTAFEVLQRLGLSSNLNSVSLDPGMVVISSTPEAGSVVEQGDGVRLELAPSSGHAPNMGTCPSVPEAIALADPDTVPAPEGSQVVTNDDRTVAAWFERPGTLPFLVVYDLVRRQELVREDLGVGEDKRKASLRVGSDAVYFQSSADPNVWLWSRWHEGQRERYPSVYQVCS